MRAAKPIPAERVIRIGRGRSEGANPGGSWDADNFPKEKQGPQSQSPRSGIRIAHAKVAKAAKARILDVGCFPAVAGRAYARIFDWGRDCSRKAPTRVRGRAAKDAKDGKGKIFDYFPKLRDARDVALG